MKEANEFFAGQVDVLTVQLVGSRSGGKWTTSGDFVRPKETTCGNTSLAAKHIVNQPI